MEFLWVRLYVIQRVEYTESFVDYRFQRVHMDGQQFQGHFEKRIGCWWEFKNGNASLLESKFLSTYYLGLLV